MPICPTCGKSFSGFSFGSRAANECPECRQARPPAPKPVRVLPLPTVTYTIIGLNVAVYLAMSLSGVSWTEPRGIDAIPWGADFGPLTLTGDWWRLLTSTFVHFGIVHIGLNMWCLWNLGLALEPLMGRKIFAAMYVASGIAASMVSLAWDPWRISAGASGAIFGVAGAYLAFLLLKKTHYDRGLQRRNLQSLGIFIFYNLVYGMRGGTDNSAHMGGLIAGLILGAAIPSIHSEFFAALQRREPGLAPALDAPLGSDASTTARENRILWTTIAGSALALCSMGVWVHGRSPLTESYGKAVRMLRVGHAPEAARQLQNVVEHNPEFSTGQAMLGEILLEQQDPSSAVVALERAAALDPSDAGVEHNLALAYLGTGKADDAVARISDALKAEKDDPKRGQTILEMAQQARASQSQAFSSTIPYSELILKSEAWPYYP